MFMPIVQGGISYLGNYFGTGADGAVTISSNTNISVTEDSGVAIKNYSSLTVNASRTLTTDNRCKALLIYVAGNCTINGTISMSARGASASASAASDFYRLKSGAGTTSGNPNTDLFPQEVNIGGVATIKVEAPQVGASGGANQPHSGGAVTGNAGAAGSAGQTGGGGGGAADGGGATGLAGAAGTAFSGGSGGGGASENGTGDLTGGTANGGAGGHGSTSSRSDYGGGGGGAGNPGGALGGAGSGGSAGGNGTGGTLILIVGGTLTFGASSTISANGVAGGTSSGGTRAGGGGGGGVGSAGGGFGEGKGDGSEGGGVEGEQGTAVAWSVAHRWESVGWLMHMRIMPAKSFSSARWTVWP